MFERIFKILRQFLLLGSKMSKNDVESGEFLWKSTKCHRTSVYLGQTNQPIYLIFTNIIANIKRHKTLKTFIKSVNFSFSG